MRVVFHYDAGPGLCAWLQGFSEQGIEVEVVAASDRAAFTRALGSCEVLWHVLEPVTREHLENAPRLKLIQKFGVGLDTIDTRAAKDLGIAVSNMPGSNAQAVAEMTLLLMLSALRRITWFDRQTRQGTGWDCAETVQEHLGELAGKIVGFVGYGAIPQRLAPIVKSMGAQILYTARARKPAALGTWQMLDDLLKAADVVSLHVPLTADTKNLIDARALEKMKPGSVLINTARGAVVDQDALCQALTSGKLAAAGLDVFAAEPLDREDPLLQLDNVVLSPHVAWLTRETLERGVQLAVENCRRLRDGENLLHRVVI